MTKNKARELNYCKYCAAYDAERGWRCGVTVAPKERIDQCLLPADAQERFRNERGLEGETKREITGEFGDRDLMKKPMKRRKKRK